MGQGGAGRAEGGASGAGGAGGGPGHALRPFKVGSKGPMHGRRGRVCAGWGWSSSRDEEWDQELWVHEKHGGVRGGLGQGECMRRWAGSGCVGGGGRGGGEPWGQEPRGMGGGAGCVRGKG